MCGLVTAHGVRAPPARTNVVSPLTINEVALRAPRNDGHSLMGRIGAPSAVNGHKRKTAFPAYARKTVFTLVARARFHGWATE